MHLAVAPRVVFDYRVNVLAQIASCHRMQNLEGDGVNVVIIAIGHAPQ
jgi:hypothetical protein